MHKTFFLVIGFLIFGISLSAQSTCKNVYAPSTASFSICIPDGLKSMSVKGQSYNAYVRDTGAGKNRFTFSIVEAHSVRPVEADAFDSIAVAYKEPDDNAVLKEINSAFANESDDLGVRWRIELNSTDGHSRISKVYYAFDVPGPNRVKVVVVLAAETPVGDSEDIALADKIAKSVKLIQK